MPCLFTMAAIDDTTITSSVFVYKASVMNNMMNISVNDNNYDVNNFSNTQL